MTQMPVWVPLPLAIALGVWSLGVGIAHERRLARLWFSPGSSGWRTAGRVLLVHGTLVALILVSVIAVIAVREATTYRTWPLGLLVVATLGLVGPIIATVMPSRSGLAPDKETLARAGASGAQATVIRGLGSPFAFVEMMLLITLCFPAFAE